MSSHARSQGANGKAMALLRRSTPFFSVLWLALLALHMRHGPAEAHLRGVVDKNNNKEPVHVVFASDAKELPGVEAAIRSIMCHSSEPVEFHYVGDTPLLSSFSNVHFYNLTEVSQKYNLEQFTNPYERKKEFEIGLNTNPANYVRFVIDELLPQATKAMWIDGDTIVRCDLAKMYRKALSENDYILSAVPVEKPPMGVNNKALKRNYGNLRISFNAGVYVVDLERWRKQKISSKARKLALQNRKKQFYKYGSQPPLVLTIRDQFEHLGWQWNVKADHLDRRPDARQDACLIHWSGTSKPWEEGEFEKEMWAWTPCPLHSNQTHGSS